MKSDSRDMTISTVLADPMILALMRADGVDRSDFEALLHAKARSLEAAKVSRAVSPLHVAAARRWAPRACLA